MRDVDASAGLITAVLAGDARALERFVEVWGPVVLRWCARLGGPTIDAEDAAHDTFERALAHLHALRDPRAFAGWLYRIARRTVEDHRRSAWLRRWVPGILIDAPSLEARADEQLADADLALEVQAAIDRLPTDLREVLVLCEVEERNAVEVAELVGVPLGTVKSRLRRARERFAREARRRGLAPDLAPDHVEEDVG